MREASSIVLAARLIAEGATVTAYDPVVGASAALPPEVEISPSPLDAADGADALVIVTEWPEFAAPVLDGSLRRRIGRPILIDGRNLLDPHAAAAAGFTYEGIGRAAPAVPAEA
jgi:UDPglucose 6-dehydrogenase